MATAGDSECGESAAAVVALAAVAPAAVAPAAVRLAVLREELFTQLLEFGYGATQILDGLPSARLGMEAPASKLSSLPAVLLAEGVRWLPSSLDVARLDCTSGLFQLGATRRR